MKPIWLAISRTISTSITVAWAYLARRRNFKFADRRSQIPAP